MSKVRKITVLALIIIVPLGFYTKFYSGPAHIWVNNSLGGFFYEIFWVLLFSILLPKVRPVIIAMAVFFATCTLEFLQLWHPPFLQILRSNFIGRTILGNSFNLMDFPYYIAGSLTGYLILKIIKKRYLL
jgi:hypothetical protein